MEYEVGLNQPRVSPWRWGSVAAAVFEAYRATSYPRVAQQNRSLAWRRANAGEKLPVMARAQKARVGLYKQIYNPCASLFLAPNHHRLPSTSVCLPLMPPGTREQNRETDADHAKGQSRPVPMLYIHIYIYICGLVSL